MLDEPTAGVDIGLRDMLWANVRRLNERGMTIILTTHYLEEAEAMCDRIAIIDRGEVLIEDTTAALLARADYVLRNDADLAALEAAANALCEQLLAEGGTKGGARPSV